MKARAAVRAEIAAASDNNLGAACKHHASILLSSVLITTFGM